jgi:hypothetical protein
MTQAVFVFSSRLEVRVLCEEDAGSSVRLSLELMAFHPQRIVSGSRHVVA